MRIKILRIAEIASTPMKPGLLPVSPATVWRWVQRGTFPKPFKLGARTTVWDYDEIRAYLARQQGTRC